MRENLELEKLFEGVVPERIDEVLSLIGTHSAQFRRVGDKSGFNLNAAGTFGAIQFTQRSLKQIWLFGFSGLFSLHCYSGIIFLAKCRGLMFDLDEIDSLPDQKFEDERFSNLIKVIENLKDADSEHDFTWPYGIPNPEYGKPKNIEQAAVFDLVLMATAYVFLHELKHVIFKSDGNAPEDPLDEKNRGQVFYFPPFFPFFFRSVISLELAPGCTFQCQGYRIQGIPTDPPGFIHKEIPLR